MRQSKNWIKNRFLDGFLTGAVVPFVGYAILLMIYDQLDSWQILNSEGFSDSFRSRTLLLVAICLNLIPMHLFRRNHYDHCMRGMVLPTMAYCLFWLVGYGRHLF